jgi:hypothetical protein
MAPDTKPGHGAKPKSPEKKPVPVVKPDATKTPESNVGQKKRGGTTKR